MEETIKPQKKDNLKRNIILNTIFRVLMIIAPFLTAPYVSRVLMSDGVGIYSYTQSLVSYFTMFAALGTVSYGTREIARNRENKADYSKSFWEIEIISLISTAICFGGWILLSLLYTEYKVYLLSYSFMLLATALDISWLYVGLEKYKYTIYVNLFFKFLSVLCIFLFVKTPNDVWVYVLIFALSSFLGNGSMWLFLPKVLCKTKIERNSLKTHFKETLVYFIPAIAISLYTVLDKTLIGALLQGETTVIVDGEEQVKKVSEIESGYYEQATKIIDMVKTLAFVSIHSVVYSRASYLYKANDGEAIKKLCLGTFQIVLLLSIGAAFGLIGVADVFVPLFFGSGYDKTILLLKIMAVLIPIISISGTLGALYYSPIGKRKQSSLFLIIGAVLNLLVSTPLVLLLKSTGAAIASILAELVISILYFIYCCRAITLKEFIFIIWKKLLSGAIMLGLLILSNYFIRGYFGNQLVYFFTEFLVGLLIYFIVLLILRDKSIMLGLNYLRKKMRKQNG